ncbi:hypothetical protein FO519_005279 [Halicephalobus sp. NKZ332]|nr:hypothetical protein FO519_005279 [Halicephalobus sp. NKZ332]
MSTRSEFFSLADGFVYTATDTLVLRIFSLPSKIEYSARTSGVLLIAGFSSYCAYRIANKYLGKGFVWTIFDATHCDLLARSDSKLLHLEPCCSTDEEKRTIISIDEFADDEPGTSQQGSTTSAKKRSIKIKSPSGTFIKLIENPNRKFQLEEEGSRKGLAGLNLTPTSSGKNSRRRSELFDELSIGGTPTEASEIRLLWDGDVIWDDEFANDPEDLRNRNELPMRMKSPTPSDISALSAFKTLQNMFDSANEAGPSVAPEADPEGSIFGDAADLAHLIHSKCMRNPNYMYHSVIVASSDVDGSDVVSVCSGRSTKSNMSALKEKYSQRSHGLWELASRPSPEKPATSNSFLEMPNRSSNPMTDSGISKSSVGSSNMNLVQGLTTPTNPMIDSAIDTGFASSDDDAASVRSASVTKPIGILRRTTLLDGIKEQPSPAKSRIGASSRMSEKSLEWFDE